MLLTTLPSKIKLAIKYEMFAKYSSIIQQYYDLEIKISINEVCIIGNVIRNIILTRI